MASLCLHTVTPAISSGASAFSEPTKSAYAASIAFKSSAEVFPPDRHERQKADQSASQSTALEPAGAARSASSVSTAAESGICADGAGANTRCVGEFPPPAAAAAAATPAAAWRGALGFGHPASDEVEDALGLGILLEVRAHRLQ